MKTLFALFMATSLLLGTGGCTYLAPKKLKQEAALAGTQKKIISQAAYMTDITVSALARETNRTPQITLAKKTAGETQLLLGIPAWERFDVDAYFASNKVETEKLKAQFNYDIELLKLRAKQEAKLDKTEDKLIAYGQTFEEERNKTIWWKFWTWSTATLIIAGIVCLCIFTPFGPMILNSLMGFLWSVVPRIASFFKLASTTVIDNIVKGNEEFKYKAKAAPVNLTPAGTTDGTYTKEQVEAMIKADRDKLLQDWKDELAKATDNTDKKIIEQRKVALNYA